jgi:hypothetical protein
MTISAGELWLAAWLVPLAVILLGWPGAPAATVAELLCAVNRPVAAKMSSLQALNGKQS